MIAPIRKPLFELGKVVVSQAALDAIRDSGELPEDYLNRHVFGDWGMIFDEQRAQNQQALASGGKIVSAYRTGNGVKIWVITESDGQSAGTIILLPNEKAS